MTTMARGRVLFAIVFLLSVLYLAQDLKRGWVPMDEATLGLSADYVLEGKLPHRDYFEGYTGGLAYLNALAFRIFGANSISLRYVLFLFAMVWVPTVYYVASQFVSPPAASALTFLAVAWGVPNYSAAMPSWYNLFFATFGLAALLRYIEVQKPHWLFVAGMCGGISFLAKQVGLFFIAGILLFLFFREQIANVNEHRCDSRSCGYRFFVCIGLLIYALFVVHLILKRPSIVSFCYFLMPAVLIVIPILWAEFGDFRSRTRRFKFLFREFAFFAVGVAVPVVIFLVPLIRARAVPAFVQEVFIAPTKQIANAATTPSLLKLLAGVGVNAALIIGIFLLRPWRNWIAGLAILAMPFGLVLALTKPFVYKTIFGTIWVLLPTLVICGLVFIVRHLRCREKAEADLQKIFLTICVTAMSSLVQFPVTAGIYFCYVAPLAVLASAAVVSFLEYRPRLFLWAAYSFVIVYVVLEVTPGSVYAIGQVYERDTEIVSVKVPRTGDLRTTSIRARTYETLDTIIRQHASGEYIFATPDCPETYFLYGFRNPTRFFFDFWDDSPGRTQRILKIINSHNINLVVLNDGPLFSSSIPGDLRTVLEQEFPNRALAGNFEVRWKH